MQTRKRKSPDSSSRSGLIRVGVKGATRPKIGQTLAQVWPWWRMVQVVVVLGFMVVILWLWPSLVNWVNQPIARVEIRAPFEVLERSEVEKQLQPYLVNRFFYLDLGEVRLALLAIPWVREASLRRTWPDVLEVNLQEQEPVARWSEEGLISGDGHVFWPKSVQGFARLPLLSGPGDQALTVMQQYQSISQLLRPMGLTVTELVLNATGSWNFKVDHVQVNIGRDRRMERLQRFVRLYHAKLDAQWASVTRVDLRYLNGASVAYEEVHSQP